MNKHKKRKAEAKKKAIDKIKQVDCMDCHQIICHGCPNEITREDIDSDKYDDNKNRKAGAV